ncbi:N-6 DNA methylase [Nitrospira sp. Nam74]
MLLSDLFSDPSIASTFTAGVEKRVLRIETANGAKGGRIDSYYGNAVIEFENSLKATSAHAEEQLREYVSGIWRSEGYPLRPLIAIASDGIVWRTYRPSSFTRKNGRVKAEDIQLEQLREITLSEKTLTDFWLWLTSLLYRPERTDPTAEQFRVDFGAESPAFHDGISALTEAWLIVRKSPEPRLAFETWQKYLTVTYGRLTAITDEGEGEISESDLETLFLKHTYLASVARLLVWASLSKGKPKNSLREVAQDVLCGHFFESHHVANMAEDDFFQWVRRDEAEAILSPVWERIIAQILTYDLSRLNEDVLKGIYQELVDPKDRHDLGEYYTPDWLCERIVAELLPGKDFASVLDPTCGSGSFLRSTITHFCKTNAVLPGRDLLQKILEHVVGIDIHPLAVTIARATYLLALGPALKSAQRPVQIPVYLADSLFLPTEVTQLSMYDYSAGIELKFGGMKVVIPHVLVESSDLFDDCIAACAKVAMEHAVSQRENVDTLEKYLKKSVPKLTKLSSEDANSIIYSLWEFTGALADLIRQKKNSIWAFIVRNTYRPAMLRGHFDFIVGNPPWLSYRFIADPDYQDEVKHRAKEYAIAPESQKLVTQMELATVFLAHCLKTFGREGAKLGFVMPRGVLSADQHANIRTRSYSAPFRLTQYWDLLDVRPLFRMPACVLFATRDTYKGKIADVLPVLEWKGSLEREDLPWGKANEALESIQCDGKVIFLGDRTALSTLPGRSEPNDPSPYAAQFQQGATIVPRSFYFIRVKELEGTVDPEKVYWAETDPDQAAEAKKPYKDVYLKGNIEGRFFYLTALSRHVVPFVMIGSSVVALPIDVHEGAVTVRNADALRKDGYREFAKWMKTAEKIWGEKRGAKAEKQSVHEWLDYQSKLTNQNLSHRYLVLYNRSGTNVSAACIDRRSLALPFVVDCTLHWLSCSVLAEADYLVAVLNAEAVNEAIKPFQSMGLLGERDIYNKVLDLPFPEYDSSQPTHVALSDLGAEARKLATRLAFSKDFPQSLAKQRAFMREQLADLMKDIDRAVLKLLKLSS